MPLPQLRVRSVLPLALVAGLSVGVIGCGGDGVQVSTVPKADVPKGAPNNAGAGEYRILGGVFPADDPGWFIKFTGSTEELTKYEADFDKLLASVSLPPNGDIDFATPDGWTRTKGEGQFGFATLTTADGKQKITVTPSKGGVFGNLERWAGQLGAPFTPADIPKATKPIDAKGVKGLRVDLRGSKNPAGKGGPFMGKQ